MRTEVRPRKYVPRLWLLMLRPLLRFSLTRDAYVLRGIGNSTGPVLRSERRRRRRHEFEGVDRRRPRVAGVQTDARLFD